MLFRNLIVSTFVAIAAASNLAARGEGTLKSFWKGGLCRGWGGSGARWDCRKMEDISARARQG